MLRSIQRLPLRLALFYIASTFGIFVFGPFDWPVDDWVALVVFLTTALACLWAGFRWAISRPPKFSFPVESRKVIIVGSAAALGILFISAPIYTGKMPW